jgi:2-iminobutanoate/2-iminopropanoate deaminase
MEIIETTDAPKAIGPYSQAIVSNNLIFCSGQIPLDPNTGKIIQGGIEQQTIRVFKNIKAILKAKDADFNKMVKLTVFLQNINDFPLMNKTYEAILQGHKPARSTIEVSALPKGALIEVECIAVV